MDGRREATSKRRQGRSERRELVYLATCVPEHRERRVSGALIRRIGWTDRRVHGWDYEQR